MRRAGTLLLTAVCFAAVAAGQTTQGVISGRLVNSVTGLPVAGASVRFTGNTSTARGQSISDSKGYYALPQLSPGQYRLRVEAMGYQAQEVQEVELAVASRLDLSFRLRPLTDVWEAGQYKSVFLPGSRTIVTFFGPDVDATRTGSFEANRGRRSPLESTVSQVIRSSDITDLPLAGRDVYTTLVTQPGVSSDGATARGLGLAANGQRPSASNFLLDGLENNNYLITGPLVPVAPQAIQEYRVSTNNFSAEYGRTSGYLANAITRAGMNGFHGTAYLYLKNEILNANGFQQNAAGRERAGYKETQPGYWVGGPVVRDRLFFSSSFEHFRSRGRQDPQVFTFPNLPVFQQFAPLGRQSRTLLDRYAPPAVGGAGLTGQLELAPPVSVNRIVAVERVDYQARRDQFTGSLLLARLTRPDFIWSPYTDFSSALHQNTWRLSGSYVHTFSANLISDFRAAYSDDDLFWNRPHPEIPTLVSSDGTMLPGSLAFYEYKNRNRTAELLENFAWSAGPNRITAGGGALLRFSEGLLSAGREPQYTFSNILNFALDRPAFVRAAIRRSTLPAIQQPDSNRDYRYQQYFGFVQDTLRLARRLTVNFGLRYEFFGAPTNTGGIKDALVVLGPGATLAEQLTGARLSTSSGKQELYGADNRNWAVRAGASYDLFGSGRTLLRASYGIFYDRPFDNLWQNSRSNDVILPLLALSSTTATNYTGPALEVLKTFQGQTLNANFPTVTLMDPNLKNGRVHSYFAGLQQRLAQRLTLEINALGSWGRRLIATDVINRDFSTAQGRYNPALPDVAYRTDAGFSDYNALSGVLRFQGRRNTLHVAYTYSHAIDNQSEPLAGDFFNLTFTSIQTAAPTSGRAAFSRQFDRQADRGNSDFDQRHNLVFFYTYNIPDPAAGSGLSILTRNWLVAGIAAFRSGFPYTLIGPSAFAGAGQGVILNNRPDLIDPSNAVLANPVPVPGGQRLLNPQAFRAAEGGLGSLGRNAFAGPGFYNVDFSLARSFGLRWLGESGRLQFRTDVFNLLNHANLGAPDTVLASQSFGIARYGRTGRSSGFPAVSPLAETPRQMQMSVQVSF